jgi:hypothetical protein
MKNFIKKIIKKKINIFKKCRIEKYGKYIEIKNEMDTKSFIEVVKKNKEVSFSTNNIEISEIDRVLCIFIIKNKSRNNLFSSRNKLLYTVNKK